jgi:putative transcriptional regulator
LLQVANVIRFRLREVMAEKAFRDGKAITIQEIADGTGLSRRVLSSLVNKRGYNTETQTLDKLCNYFQCRLEQIAEHVYDNDLGQVQPKQSKRLTKAVKND